MTGLATLPSPSPSAAAEAALRDVLQTQWDGITAVRLDSPPGAGKTGVVERLAVQALGLMAERCMVVTQTNEQAFDVARRLGRGFPRLGFHLFARRGLVIPPDLAALPNVQVVHEISTLPPGPCVAIGNAAKWSWVAGATAPFDLQVVDEAFQLPDYRFQQIAGLGRRLVLVGDPGQIAPIVTCEIERWKTDAAGPHVACPRALVARHPGVRQMALPVSRRLVPDTVAFVQPAFYPELPFAALSAPGDRGIQTRRRGGASPLDSGIDLVESGASLVQLELPPVVTGEADVELADALVRLIGRLLERKTTVLDDGRSYRLEPTMIGVVCAHVSQVNAVRERLPDTQAEVFVETSDRFQGLERPIILVHHPLSGRADASEFHLDAGRLCVMLSRHRVACFVLMRGGVEDMLQRYAPAGERVLGRYDDAEFEGWRAHVALLQALRDRRRIVRL